MELTILFCVTIAVLSALFVFVTVSLLRLLRDAQDRIMSMSGTLAQYQMSKAPEPSIPPEIVVNHPITGQPLRMVHKGGGEFGPPDEDLSPPSTVSDVEGSLPFGSAQGPPSVRREEGR